MCASSDRSMFELVFDGSSLIVANAVALPLTIRHRPVTYGSEITVVGTSSLPLPPPPQILGHHWVLNGSESATVSRLGISSAWPS